MKNLNLLKTVCTILFFSMVAAQVAAQQTETKPTPPNNKPAKPSQAELEQRFIETLTNVVLDGAWRMTQPDPTSGEATLGQPREEQYTIAKVTKVEGDRWLIAARIKYADKDVTLPVPVRVIWAEQTPMITLDEVSLPFLGTYSARVMFHEGFYSGVWCGGDHGGVMSGRIVKQQENKTESGSKADDSSNDAGGENHGNPRPPHNAGRSQERDQPGD